MSIRRYFPLLLLGVYAAAFSWPQPELARWRIKVPGWPAWIEPPGLSLLLLAAILFAAALSLDVSRLRDVLRRPVALALALAAVWIGPVLLVLVADALLPKSGAFAGPMLGLAIVAAMPVANSSVGWTQQARGDLGWGLALVVLSIVLNPWITPQLLTFMGGNLADGRAASIEHFVTQFSGTNFIVWVLLPTAAGLAAGALLGRRRLGTCELPVLAISAACLLALNFVNASQARLPELPILAVMLCLALLLSSVGLGSAWLVAKFARLDSPTRLALLFALSMKHNGLALALAGAMIHDLSPAIPFIIVAILVQHAVAAFVDAWAVRRNGLVATPTNRGAKPSPGS